jgi:hypothetical protein
MAMHKENAINRTEFKDYNQYEISITPITGSKSFKPVCSTIIFQNQGGTVAVLDGQWYIYPGQALEITGYPGEVNIHGFDISFIPVTGQQNNLMVLTKNYPK